jgi:hypothetical protein
VSSGAPSSERFVRWLPAVAALGLAGLYSVGALLTAASLRGAGLAVRDTLPLFSLEKLLARGISTLVGSVVLLIALVLLGMLAVAATTTMKRRRWGLGATAAAAIATAALVIFGLAFSSPVLAAALLLSFAVGVAAPRMVPELQRGWVWAAQYLIILAGLVASAYVYPQPLPTAHVDVEDGPSVVGDLITTTDFSWYVAGFDNDSVRAIPAADIVDAEFASRERETPPKLKDLVSDLFD